MPLNMEQEQHQVQTLSELCLLVGRMEGKVDRLLSEQTTLRDIAKQNETRILRLEKDRSVVYGAATVLAIIGSAVIWIISHFFKG